MVLIIELKKENEKNKLDSETATENSQESEEIEITPLEVASESVEESKTT